MNLQGSMVEVMKPKGVLCVAAIINKVGRISYMWQGVAYTDVGKEREQDAEA